MSVIMDVFDTAGRNVGDGPITTIQYFRGQDRMDRAGEWYAEMPAADPRARFVRAKRIVEFYSLDERGKRFFLRGQIEERKTIRTREIPPTLALRGSGQMRELILTTIPYGTSYTALRDVPAALINDFANADLLPDAWALTGQTQTARAITMNIYGDNVLEALSTIADITGEHFRRGIRQREIVWLGTDQDLEHIGLTATTQRYIGSDPNRCRILDIQHTEDAWELYNGIYAYAATGDDANPLDMRNATTWPDDTPITDSQRVLDDSGAATNAYRHNLGGSFWVLDKDQNLLINESSRDIEEYGPSTKTNTFNELSVAEDTPPA